MRTLVGSFAIAAAAAVIAFASPAGAAPWLRLPVDTVVSGSGVATPWRSSAVAVRDGGGFLHVAWTDGAPRHGVYSGPLLAVDTLPFHAPAADSPAATSLTIAVADDGQVLMAWFEHRLAGAIPHAIVLARKHPHGSWTTEEIVAVPAGVQLLSMQPLHVGTRRRVAFSWSSPDAGSFQHHRAVVTYRTIDWTRLSTVDECVGSSGCVASQDSAIATNGADYGVVAWEEKDAAGVTHVYFSDTSDGGATWSVPALAGGGLVEAEGGDPILCTAAAGAGSHVFAAFQRAGAIQIARKDRAGGAGFALVASLAPDAGDASYFAGLSCPAGAVLVAWEQLDLSAAAGACTQPLEQCDAFKRLELAHSMDAADAHPSFTITRAPLPGASGTYRETMPHPLLGADGVSFDLFWQWRDAAQTTVALRRQCGSLVDPAPSCR